MKNSLLIILLLTTFLGFSQEQDSNLRQKKVAVSDSIKIDSISINPSRFKVKTKDNKLIDSTLYSVDFAKAILRFKQPIEIDTIHIEYLRYPKFLTQVYRQLDDGVIVDRSSQNQQLYTLQNASNKSTYTPFDGLTTSGSISRGVTIGNNQNSVLNSELDLQISGKLSDKVSLRASIQDANIPLQESGYSQRLDEFDQVFIELYSDDWNIRAGDIDLVNTNSYFANFSKRVQGLLVNANLSEKTSVFASGALVRGQFTTTQFTAEEGNQGPYKLRGSNNELYVLVVSGSETVYVNGVPLERGENNDYIIDYNAGEIIFNSTYPITSEMRITVDYQFSERNYSRFTVFGGAKYETKKLKLNVSVYSESDAKNQPLQQNLSTEQTQILAEAGDDVDLMTAPSETLTSYSENRILYKKEVFGTEEIFVFSNDPEDELYNVRFTLVGTNQGNYILSNTNAITNIYEYIAPIAGVPQGNYEPITQLIAPERLQIAVINGQYKPSEKTAVFFELAGSKKDENLFSSLDDANNDGYAGKFTLKQNLIKSDSLWNLSALVDADYIQKNFNTIQRLYRAEFNRDWNLDTSEITDDSNIDYGNQLLFTSGLKLSHLKKGYATYNFEHLNYSENFNGNRHNIAANLHLGNFKIFSNSSVLNNESTINQSTFVRSFNSVVYGKDKKWAGVKFSTEDNEQRAISNDSLTPLSQKYKAYEAFVGIGDSTKVFAEVGYIKRFNDSLRNNSLERVNSSNTYYLNSRLIQNKNTTLQLYANYRDLKSEDTNIEDEQSLNSRLTFNQKLFKNLIILNTNFETNSGTLAQQDFTYVEVEAGQGAYTWIDYNENNIQELDEFEIAQFADQGSYIRVLLPNQVYVQTHQNRFGQTVTINPQIWSVSKDKSKQFWSHFYDQASFIVDSKTFKNGNSFNLNPFEALKDDLDTEDYVSLNYSLRNVLFLNRGKQRYTTSYTFLTNKSRNLLSIGFQQNKTNSHQLNFTHKFNANWLVNSIASLGTDDSRSENYTSRNYTIDNYQFKPKLSYLFSENAQFDVFYQYTSKENTIGSLESLAQNNYGLSFTYNNTQKIALTGEFNFFQNDFEGDANTPVGYQMLEGLQAGKNYTWSLLAQKKLTKYLDLNLTYFGRKSETSKTIHTGTIQLKAYF
ncbi:hypothetical protein [Winogradskyella sp. 4-2091]|uniref:hypothetical protein n=1 Tax=Winogradskyella sp. 4-2091 TaxID=3381659 RepID=UPI003891762E